MIKLAIVEDEPAFRDKMCQCLERFSQEKGVLFDIAVFENGAEFVFNYHSGYDIILMDIEMPYMNGMDAARSVRKKDGEVVIVFITNMANYAVQGYEVEALDFIVKPFTYEMFKFRMERITARLDKKKSDYSIVLNSNDQVYRINVSNLMYIEVNRHALTYHTDKENISVRGSMKEAEAALTPFGFCKCSQSFLVNLRYVSRVELDDVYLGNAQIHISRGSKKELIRALAEYTAK